MTTKEQFVLSNDFIETSKFAMSWIVESNHKQFVTIPM